MTFVPIIIVSFSYLLRQASTHVFSNQFIWESLSAGSQVSFDFCVECLSDILRVQNIPPAEWDTEGNAPRQAPQRDWGKECENYAGYLPSVVVSISGDFEGVPFDMGRAGGAGADLDGTTREELIVRERINPRNNIRADILLGIRY